MGEYVELALEQEIRNMGVFDEWKLFGDGGIPEMHTFAEWRLLGFGVFRGEKATWIDGKPLFYGTQVGRIRQ